MRLMLCWSARGETTTCLFLKQCLPGKTESWGMSVINLSITNMTCNLPVLILDRSWILKLLI